MFYKEIIYPVICLIFPLYIVKFRLNDTRLLEHPSKRASAHTHLYRIINRLVRDGDGIARLGKRDQNCRIYCWKWNKFWNFTISIKKNYYNERTLLKGDELWITKAHRVGCYRILSFSIHASLITCHAPWNHTLSNVDMHSQYNL